MKYLIIYAHPNPKSFNHAMVEIIKEKLKETGEQFEVRDLYEIGFKPELCGDDLMALEQRKGLDDVRREQDYISKAEVIIFIHPIWWFNMPAIMKGYIDRVFSHGFAFDVDENGAHGLLTDKEVIIFNTTGGPEENYTKNGYEEALRKTIEDGIFGFCGMRVILHKYFYAVPYVTDEARQKMLEELKSIEI